MSDESDQVVIFDGIGGPSTGTWDDAPIEAIIKNVRMGNIDAWKALLRSLGKTEEDFIKEVADNVAKSIIEDLEKEKNAGTVK